MKLEEISWKRRGYLTGTTKSAGVSDCGESSTISVEAARRKTKKMTTVTDQMDRGCQWGLYSQYVGGRAFYSLLCPPWKRETLYIINHFLKEAFDGAGRTDWTVAGEAPSGVGGNSAQGLDLGGGGCVSFPVKRTVEGCQEQFLRSAENGLRRGRRRRRLWKTSRSSRICNTTSLFCVLFWKRTF